MTDELIVRREGAAGFLTLNRPKAIHALTAAMDHAMTEALLKWRDDPEVKLVIIDHSEGRGFCSGGDIAFLRNSALNDNGVSGRRFFYEEYQLNHLLFTYPKPVVAFMDGITMGGGVGISQPARYRVATENTRYAMPETGNRPVPRRRRRLVPGPAAGPHRPVPGPDRNPFSTSRRNASGPGCPRTTCRRTTWKRPSRALPPGTRSAGSCRRCR